MPAPAEALALYDSQTRAIPHFFMKAVEDPAATEREGRPVFRDEEYVEIIIPANPKTRPCFRVDQEYRAKFADEYKRWKQGLEQRPEGMPLEEAPFMTRTRIAELRAVNVFTVEQLAGVTDGDLPKLGMDARLLRDKAIRFLQPEAEAIRAERARAEALAQENERLRADLQAAQGIIQENARPKRKAEDA